MTVPVVGRTMPMIVFIVVDLPQALPPSRQTISTGGDVVIHVLQHVQVTVMRVHIAGIPAGTWLALTIMSGNGDGNLQVGMAAAEIGVQHCLVAAHRVRQALRQLLAVIEHNDRYQPTASPRRPACAQSPGC